MSAALVTLIVFASATLAACVCDPYIHVDVENRMDERVVVFDDGIERGVIDPGDSGDFAIHTFEGNRTFTVKTLDGRILASRTFTWDDILMKFEITIVVEE